MKSILAHVARRLAEDYARSCLAFGLHVRDCKRCGGGVDCAIRERMLDDIGSARLSARLAHHLHDDVAKGGAA